MIYAANSKELRATVNERGPVSKKSTENSQILTMYLKIHQMHVKNIQKCNFLKIKKTTLHTITQNLS